MFLLFKDNGYCFVGYYFFVFWFLLNIDVFKYVSSLSGGSVKLYNIYEFYLLEWNIILELEKVFNFSELNLVYGYWYIVDCCWRLNRIYGRVFYMIYLVLFLEIIG